ncbi:MAG TPA: 16S rRNA (guanine(966)-N(2))-methyltransferase RsmD [Bryobacteraceae bacterium]|nr:16S rRNA (guanine(966)-N(2))-methyltransferase RsmD [Bryobacteraceae bacterium]
MIAGEFRSRKLKTVPGLNVRPTPDRLRESLFNVLAPRLPGATFIDAYAGSGAVGIEAVSRGAGRVILIERNAEVIAVIRENVAALGIAERVTVLRGRAVSFLAAHQADFVFLDPPYEHTNEYSDALRLLAGGRSKEVIAQHSARLRLEDTYGELRQTRQIKQGDNVLSFYVRL